MFEITLVVARLKQIPAVGALVVAAALVVLKLKPAVLAVFDNNPKPNSLKY